MMQYENVKVGDKVFYAKVVGIYHWGDLYYAKTFFIECEVIRVTKTQFTTESGRYRKSDGYCVGDGYSIYKLGDNPRFLRGCQREVVKCEASELAEYNNELQVVRDAQNVDLGKFRITQIKDLEKAQKAASLIKELKLLF